MFDVYLYNSFCFGYLLGLHMHAVSTISHKKIKFFEESQASNRSSHLLSNTRRWPAAERRENTAVLAGLWFG